MPRFTSISHEAPRSVVCGPEILRCVTMARVDALGNCLARSIRALVDCADAMGGRGLYAGERGASFEMATRRTLAAAGSRVGTGGRLSLSPHRARLLWVSFSLSVAPASSSLCPAFEALLSHRAVSIHFSELLSAEWSGSLVVRGSASGSTAVAVQAVKWRSRSSGALTWRRLRSVYAGAVIWQAFDKRRDPRDPACLSPCIPSSGRFVACVHLILRIPKRAFRSPSIGSRAARF